MPRAGKPSPFDGLPGTGNGGSLPDDVEKPAWWNDKSQAVYSRLPDGALMGFGDDRCWGRERLGMNRWHTLRKFEQASPADESWDGGDTAA